MINIKDNNFLQWIVYICATLIIIIGVVVLIGWFTQNIALVRLSPSFISVKFNTALCLVICGSALILIVLNKSVPATILFGVSGLIALITLIQYIFNVDLWVDYLSSSFNVKTPSDYSGRMSFNTSLCLLLSAISAFLTINSTKLFYLQVSSFFSSLVFAFASVAFIGYVIGIEQTTYAWHKYISTSARAAFSLMILAVGLSVLVRSKVEYLKLATRNFINQWLIGYLVSMLLAFFLIDCTTPTGLANGILYIFVILVGWYINMRYIMIALASVSMMLIVAGYFFSPVGTEALIAGYNRIIAIIVIWVTAVLLDNVRKQSVAIEKANIQILAKNKELEQFTYIASHDLQEPLRTVSSFIGLIKENYVNRLDDQAVKYIEYISQASYRMSQLIKGLLDYSRIGRDKVKSQIISNTLIEDIKIDLHEMISKTNSVIEYKELPTVYGFKTDIRLLFQNLITNAIKFSKNETMPFIKISAIKNDLEWKFCIEDNGIGIEKQYYDKIFLIFQRLHSKAEFEGTGIGLAHCVKIVNLHGGKIWVDSEVGKGSKFYFTIPD